MAPVLPTELLHHILGSIEITWKWDWHTKYARDQAVARQDLAWFMSLRLVSRLFDSVVMDHFLAAVKAQERTGGNSSARRGPPTWSGVAMGRRLLEALVSDCRDPTRLRSRYSLINTIIEGARGSALLAPQPPDWESSPDPCLDQSPEIYTDAMISILGTMGADQIIAMYAGEGDLEDLHIDSEAWQGAAALMTSAYLGRIEAMKSLLKLPGVAADSDPGNKWLYPPLVAAALGGHLDMVKFLIKESMDLNTRTVRNGANVVHFAALGGHTELVRFLLDEKHVEGDIGDNDGHTPLVWAAAMRHEGVVLELLHRQKFALTTPDAQFEADALFLQALKSGKVSIVEAVTSAIPDILRKEDILLRAVEEGTEAVLRYILSVHKSPLNYDGEESATPLYLAVCSGDLGKVKALLEQPGLDVNITKHYSGGTPLHSQYDVPSNLEIVKALLAHPDINVNAQDISGMTPLAMAALYGETELVKLLLAREDVDFLLAGRSGETPLMHCAGGEDTIEPLLERMGTNIWQKCSRGRTLLAKAAIQDDEELMTRLLDPALGLTRDIVSDAVQSVDEYLKGPQWLPKKISRLVEIREHQATVRQGTYPMLLKYLEQMDS